MLIPLRPRGFTPRQASWLPGSQKRVGFVHHIAVSFVIPKCREVLSDFPHD